MKVKFIVLKTPGFNAEKISTVTPEFSYPQGYFFAESLSEAEQYIFRDAKHFFNLGHSVVLVDKAATYTQFCFMGGFSDNRKSIDLCINNIDLLQKFVPYFKERPAKLIEAADQDRIIVSNKSRPLYPSHLLTEADRNAFLKEIFFAPGNDNFFAKHHVSKRELDCIFYTLQGKTAKEIGHRLSISFKTVENHLANIKTKLKCKNKLDLIKKAFELISNR